MENSSAPVFELLEDQGLEDFKAIYIRFEVSKNYTFINLEKGTCETGIRIRETARHHKQRFSMLEKKLGAYGN